MGVGGLFVVRNFLSSSLHRRKKCIHNIVNLPANPNKQEEMKAFVYKK